MLTEHGRIVEPAHDFVLSGKQPGQYYPEHLARVVHKKTSLSGQICAVGCSRLGQYKHPCRRFANNLVHSLRPDQVVSLAATQLRHSLKVADRTTKRVFNTLCSQKSAQVLAAQQWKRQTFSIEHGAGYTFNVISSNASEYGTPC